VFESSVVGCVCGIETGRLMARFCVAFDTMKIFHDITGHESMEELVSQFSFLPITRLLSLVNQHRLSD